MKNRNEDGSYSLQVELFFKKELIYKNLFVRFIYQRLNFTVDLLFSETRLWFSFVTFFFSD